jgi:hypothetical protein
MSESGQTRFMDPLTVNRIMKPCAKFDAGQAVRYELRFLSLLEGGRGFAFPCDVDGRVNIVCMSEGSRNDYFYARKVVGREFSVPAVAAIVE